MHAYSSFYKENKDKKGTESSRQRDKDLEQGTPTDSIVSKPIGEEISISLETIDKYLNSILQYKHKQR